MAWLPFQKVDKSGIEIQVDLHWKTGWSFQLSCHEYITLDETSTGETWQWGKNVALLKRMDEIWSTAEIIFYFRFDPKLARESFNCKFIFGSFGLFLSCYYKGLSNTMKFLQVIPYPLTNKCTKRSNFIPSSSQNLLMFLQAILKTTLPSFKVNDSDTLAVG